MIRAIFRALARADQAERDRGAALAAAARPRQARAQPIDRLARLEPRIVERDGFAFVVFHRPASGRITCKP